MKRVIYSIAILLSISFLIQGFQCASREMTTAKTEYAKKNYTTAVENLEKELANNPANEEALMLLAKIKIDQGKLQQAAKIIKDAETKVQSEKYKSQIPAYKSNLWINSYNNGITKYRMGYNSGDKATLDSALFYFNTGIIIRPEILDFYNLKGFTLREMGDTVKAIQAFEKYVSMLDEEIAFAKENQVYWNMIVQDAINKLKIETDAQADTTQNGKILRVDQAKFGTDDLNMYSTNDESGNFKIKGFRLNLPDDWTDSEKTNFFEFQTDAFRIVAQYYYSKNEFRKALDVSKKLQKLDPFDKTINNFVVQIYRDLGQEDDAIAELKDLTSNNPDNELYWLLLADLYANLENYDKAIETYQKALQIDENYGIAHRNLGSTYKNKASIMQARESEKAEKDDTYEIDRNIYFPFLKKSAASFEKALESKDYAGSAEVLTELAEIYHITDEEQMLKKTLARLENIENNVPDYYKEKYYLNLLRIYSDRKNSAKSQEIQRKLEDIN